VAADVLEVRELDVRCLTAPDTYHLGVAVIEIVIFGSFDNSSLENFQFGFWLKSFGAQVFW
jgi:hypothetical protein